MHALPGHILEQIPAHVLGEFTLAACGGATVFAAVSAVCNRLKGGV
jgi:hypothetical protein